MVESMRRSPVELPGQAARIENRDGFLVVLEYENQGNGPFLVDLSHRPKWDLQAPDLESLRPLGLEVPRKPGQCRVLDGLVVGRQNRAQAAFWRLGKEMSETPQNKGLTDVTDGWMLLALIGSEIFLIMEKVSSLDLSSPAKDSPFWIQGPVLHVPCQVVVLGREGDRSALLLACSRGYGRTMAHALLDAGHPWGLRPAGEEAFTHRIEFWSTGQKNGDCGK
jgi:hypothetical protein